MKEIQKNVVDDLLKMFGAKTKSVTTRYFFPHKNKRDKKLGKEGNASHNASIFMFTARGAGFTADYYEFGEKGTGVEVTEIKAKKA